MSALDGHPLLRESVRRAAQRVLTALEPGDAHMPAPEEPVEDPADTDVDSMPAAGTKPTPADFERKLHPAYLGVERSTVTNVLYERLTDADVAATEQLLRDTPGAWEHYELAPDAPSKRNVLLALGMWLGAPELIERTGLLRAEPPEDVHSMTRGAMSAAGGLYEADFVVDALATVGGDMSQIATALDFGCSSGRVLRPLVAAYPDIHWHGCDPNAPAVAWAGEHLPQANFFVSGDAPPLPLQDASLDLAYAISIWSHFAPELGLAWFEEMRRLIRPGGYLVCTTHGLTAVAHYALQELRTPEQSREIADALYSKGWWYAPEFGEEGDWGVVNPEWGTAFLSPEWMLAQLCPRWRVLEFAPGRNQDNQDVYVLQRV
jgi:SAM-dependent methyltransferase